MVSELKELFFKELKKNFDHRTIDQFFRIYQEDKTWEKGISESQHEEIIRSDLNRIKNGEPIQYIVGKAYFYDRLLNVTKDVLIPRPETEELVSLVLQRHRMDTQLSILDIGTGSGCIAILLKDHLNDPKVYALDNSEKAISVAQSNAEKYNLDITFLQLNFLDEEIWRLLPDLDIIVSNPPYIQEKEKRMMTNSVLNYEPMNALIPDHPDPLIFYRSLATLGLRLFKGHGNIYAEINEFLGPETEALFVKAGYQVMLCQDMQGKDRMIIASINTLK